MGDDFEAVGAVVALTNFVHPSGLGGPGYDRAATYRTGCRRPPDPLVIECDRTLRMYNNQISEYLVSGNSAFWPDGRIR